MNINMIKSTAVPITKAIFHESMSKVLVKVHGFVLPGEIVDGAIAPLIDEIKNKFNIDPEQTKIELVTIPLTTVEKERIRAIMGKAGYHAYMSNEDMLCDNYFVEYCELNLIRYNFVKYPSEG